MLRAFNPEYRTLGKVVAVDHASHTVICQTKARTLVCKYPNEGGTENICSCQLEELRPLCLFSDSRGAFADLRRTSSCEMKSDNAVPQSGNRTAPHEDL